jgi:hypothetical protein
LSASTPDTFDQFEHAHSSVCVDWGPTSANWIGLNEDIIDQAQAIACLILLQ